MLTYRLDGAASTSRRVVAATTRADIRRVRPARVIGRRGATSLALARAIARARAASRSLSLARFMIRTENGRGGHDP